MVRRPSCAQQLPQAHGVVAQAPLLVAALVLYTVTSWLQERVSRSPEFNGPLLVLGETGSYVVLGLLWAYVSHGFDGVQSCVSLSHYVLFLPASLAFFTINLSQYPSIRVFGVVNHSLLCQLNLVVMAALLFFWKGQHVSAVQWAALGHLSLGLVMLVALTSTAGDEPSASLPHFSAGEYMLAVLAVVTVIGASAFASVYLESVLKAHSQDSLFVQMHQMNLVQACTALALFLHGGDHQSKHARWVTPQTVLFLCLTVTRGATISLVLKRAGSLANGALGVATIVSVAALQLVFEGRQPRGLGLQFTLLLSLVNYLLSEQHGKGRAPAASTASSPEDSCPNGSCTPRTGAWDSTAAIVQALLFCSLLLFLPHGIGPLTGAVSANR